MKVSPKKTKVFKEGDDLLAFIQKSLPRLPNKSVLVVTSKIVALSERRTIAINDRARYLKSESGARVKTPYVWLTLKDGMLLPNAGIDDSNADDRLTLLPADSMQTAVQLRTSLKKFYKVKDLGVIISDSTVLPLRAGVTGIALGYAGIQAVRDYRGKKDLFGRVFRFSQTNVADSLATAANLIMGEGSERQPLAVITEAPVVFVERASKNELVMDPRTDMYAPILKKFLKKKRRPR